MKRLVEILLILAALAFIIGSVIAFLDKVFILHPEGYWRGAVGLLGFAMGLSLYKLAFCSDKKK